MLPAQVLFPSLVSAMTAFGSTAHVPPGRGLTNGPPVVGVTGMPTWNVPDGPIATLVPVAVQVSVLIAMVQRRLPLLLTLPTLETVGAP